MDTRLLHTYLALARTGTFTATAAELHLAQSTVTSHIKTLERQLGARLLDRLPDGSTVTEAGQRLAHHAREVLDAEHRLLESVRSGGVPEGEVTVGATESMCSYRLPSLIAALASTLPAVTVNLLPVGTEAALEGLRERRLDIALVLGDEPSAKHMDVRPIGREPIEIVAAPGHPAASREPTWTDLAAYSYFLLEEGCSYSDQFVRALTTAAQTRPRITRFGSIEAARSCVAAGLGLSVLPRVAVAPQLADDTLCRLGFPARPDAEISVVTDSRRWSSPAALAVVEALTDAATAWSRCDSYAS